MEFIGRHLSDQTEIRARMPKFGNIENTLNDNIMENYDKKENIIRTMMRHHIPGKTCERIRQGIYQLLKLHPCPRYCGPFTGSITGHWEYNRLRLVVPPEESSDRDKQFLYFVTFTHSDNQICGTWTFDKIEPKSTSINRPIFKVHSQLANLSGPASTMSKTIVYTCEHGTCSIQCPCNLCTSYEEPCSRYCAESPCEECDQQCQEHKIELDRTYSKTDSFTIPFYYENLDEDAKTEDTNRFIVYPIEGTFSPESKFIKYAGIPRRCKKCQEDLLDHEVRHSVLHYRCKFCRKSLRLIRNYPVDLLQFVKEKERTEMNDNSTCAFCYKYLTDSAKRKYHERTEHTLGPKPFKCGECSQSFASQVGLNHHQRKHSVTPKKYLCETCNKLFTAEMALKRHIKSVHLNGRKLQCDSCDKSFTRADNLTRHFLEVHGEPSVNTQYVRQFAKPFKCDYCGSRFKRKAQLKAHSLLHHQVDTEIFKCDICLKTFSTMTNKRRHFYTVHSKESNNYKCIFCPKSFGRKDNLSKHVKLCHSS